MTVRTNVVASSPLCSARSLFAGFFSFDLHFDFYRSNHTPFAHCVNQDAAGFCRQHMSSGSTIRADRLPTPVLLLHQHQPLPHHHSLTSPPIQVFLQPTRHLLLCRRKVQLLPHPLKQTAITSTKSPPTWLWRCGTLCKPQPRALDLHLRHRQSATVSRSWLQALPQVSHTPNHYLQHPLPPRTLYPQLYVLQASPPRLSPMVDELRPPRRRPSHGDTLSCHLLHWLLPGQPPSHPHNCCLLNRPPPVPWLLLPLPAQSHKQVEQPRQ